MLLKNEEENKSQQLPSRQYAEILEKHTPEPDLILSCKNKKAIIKSFQIKRREGVELTALSACLLSGEAHRLRRQQPHICGRVAGVTGARRLHQVLPHQRLHLHGAGQEDLGDRAHQCKSQSFNAWLLMLSISAGFFHPL